MVPFVGLIGVWLGCIVVLLLSLFEPVVGFVEVRMVEVVVVVVVV